MRTAERARGPLSHITVLDLTQFLAGPYASQILGDLGARVIKVEPPEGEMTRTVPPHFVRGESAYFLSVNRNKEGLALDLKSDRGRQIFLELVKKADVVLENFRPGVLKRLGLDYEALKGANPQIVLCSISGFGQNGPYRDKPAYDIIVQAMSGGMSITGEEDGRPVRAGVPLGDLAAGMYAVIGSLAGLARVKEAGEGSYIDISMLDCQIAMLTYQAAYYLLSGEVPGPQGRGHRSIPTYRAFMCGDGTEVVVAANTERMWAGLCRALKCEGLVADERFLTNADRLRNRQALDPILERAFAAMPVDDVLARLQQEEVPSAPINTIDRALNDPQVRERGMVIPLEDETGSAIRVVGNPIKTLSSSEPARPTYPPRVGASTVRVLRDLCGLTPSDVETLVAAGVVGIARS